MRARLFYRQGDQVEGRDLWAKSLPDLVTNSEALHLLGNVRDLG